MGYWRNISAKKKKYGKIKRFGKTFGRFYSRFKEIFNKKQIYKGPNSLNYYVVELHKDLPDEISKNKYDFINNKKDQSLIGLSF